MWPELQVLTACLSVPVLLGLIRHTWQQQGPKAAAALAAGGTLLLLLCDVINKSAAKQQAAAQAACVTATNLQQQLQNGEGATRFTLIPGAWLSQYLASASSCHVGGPVVTLGPQAQVAAPVNLQVALNSQEAV